MRQIKEVLRLYYECHRSQRDIADVVGASRSTVWDYLHRAKLAQLTCEQAMQLDEAVLDARLFPPVPASRCPRPMPNWPLVHRELGRKNVTLDLLWNEYKAQEPEGYGYSWFCKHYELWAASLPVTLRQTHVRGEKLFIDYSGNRLGIVDPHTGEIREAELFSACYLRMPKFNEEMAIAHGSGGYSKLLAQWAKTDILLMDDLAMAPLADAARRDLLEILDDRHGLRSTIITSQIPVESWHAAIGDPTLADAILDRLVHNAHRLTLSGESMRKRRNGLTDKQESE